MAFDITPGFSLTETVRGLLGSQGVANPGSVSKLSDMNTKNGGQPGDPRSGKRVEGSGTAAPVKSPYDASAAGGGGGGEDYSSELGQLGANEALLRDMLGKYMGSYDQGYRNIDDSWNSSRNAATGQQERALRDYNTKQTDAEMGKEQAIGKVDTNARTLADSLRRMIGMSAGSGSSAYQITAPDAVSRKASLERSDVQEGFGRNFRDIATARKDTEDDYTKLLGELEAQRNNARREFETGLGEQINGIQGQLHDVATQRAAYQGKNAAGIAAAGAPIRADITSRDTALNSLFDKYRTPVQSRDLNVKDVNLRDYVVDRANINAGSDQQTVAASPYVDPFRQKKDEELNPLY